ncbi:MAG: nitrate/nitrite transporter NrtS [Flavobacteriaceae bacterium]|nr:nitrate/nitrite transporter NrtS [Flavobacteriaceae bacterium]
MLLKICKIVLEKDIVISSLKLAIVVGSVLNLINQGEYLVSFQWEAISWSKFALTFVAPYLVSSYASVRMRLLAD